MSALQKNIYTHTHTINTLMNLAHDGGKKYLRETENKCIFRALVYQSKKSSILLGNFRVLSRY